MEEIEQKSLTARSSFKADAAARRCSSNSPCRFRRALSVPVAMLETSARCKLQHELAIFQHKIIVFQGAIRASEKHEEAVSMQQHDLSQCDHAQPSSQSMV